MQGAEQEIMHQALKWIPRAPRGERDADEMVARDDGVGGFSITESGPDGILQPSSESDEYCPVYYVNRWTATRWPWASTSSATRPDSKRWSSCATARAPRASCLS